MKLSDVAQESAGYIKPKEEGIKVRLAALPVLELKERADKREFDNYEIIKLTFKAYDGDAEFNTNMFSPYQYNQEKYDKGLIENKGKKRADTENGKYVNQVNGNFTRLLHVFGCFMKKENYEKLQDMDLSDTEEFLAAAESLYDDDLFNLELDTIIGYDDKGFTQWPKYGDCLSSKHKPKDLVFKQNFETGKKFTLLPTSSNASPDSESRGSTSSTPRNTSVV